MTGMEVIELILLVAAGVLGLIALVRNRWTDIALLGMAVIMLALVGIFQLLNVH